MPTITADQAKDILEASYGDPGDEVGNFTYVTTIKGGTRRWMQSVMIVVSDSDDAFWGPTDDRGLTEEQPNEYPWRDGGTCELTRLYPHTITRTEYRSRPVEASAR